MIRTRRYLIFTSIILALCLIGGTLWVQIGKSAKDETEPSFAPDIIKMSPAQKTGQPPAALPVEPIQKPKAEVLSNRVTEYHIEVRLDEQERTLTGTQTMTWTHPGKKTVNELYLHLYPNAFDSMDTTFMRESGGRLRDDLMPKDGFGSLELSDLRTSDGISLLHRLQYVQPDDGNPKDRTLAKVRLPVSVRGGEKVTLYAKYTVKLPKVFARMGMTGNFVMAGQWFPKFSVYEPQGTRGRVLEGWNLHQYHGNSEFYSDFGIYNVKVNVPDTYTVAATGFPTKAPVLADGRKTVHYYADDVHDFAWSASPDFIYAEEPFSTSDVPGVRIKLYLDPAHEDLKERYFHAAKVALSNFSKWYGRYPYSTLSIVVPPASANGAGGMEYPTLVTSFGANSASPGYDELERTVIHEIGHQFFYGMVASNEFEEAWLDESFTSYAEDKLMEQEFGISPNLPIQSAIVTSPAPLINHAWKYGSSEAYTQNVYYRGKLILLDMERRVGSKTMNRILSTYSHKYRFKHPTTADFQRVVEQVTGYTWKSYFSTYVYDDKMADFAVDQISIHNLSKDGSPKYESTIDISRKGGTHPKVPILFTFKDGHTVRKVWNGENSHLQMKLQYKEPLEWVLIDPDHSLVLENRHINNYMKADIAEPVRTRSNLTASKLLEAILGSVLW